MTTVLDFSGPTELCKCGAVLDTYNVEWRDESGGVVTVYKDDVFAISVHDADIFVGNREGSLTHDARFAHPYLHDVVNWSPGSCTAVMQVCRVCGCTEARPCDGEEGEGCTWVETDLCSVCAARIKAELRKARLTGDGKFVRPSGWR